MLYNVVPVADSIVLYMQASTKEDKYFYLITKKEEEEEKKTAKEYKCIMGSNGPIYYFNQGSCKCTCSDSSSCSH